MAIWMDKFLHFLHECCCYLFISQVLCTVRWDRCLPPALTNKQTNKLVKLLISQLANAGGFIELFVTYLRGGGRRQSKRRCHWLFIQLWLAAVPYVASFSRRKNDLSLIWPTPIVAIFHKLSFNQPDPSNPNLRHLLAFSQQLLAESRHHQFT